MQDETPVQDETPWCLTTATVTKCKETFATSMVDETAISDEGIQPPEFLITFSYAVRGQTYYGRYKAGAPVEPGHSFEIQYDASNPQRNTESEVVAEPWPRVIVWIVVGVIAALVIWLSMQISN